MTDTRTNPSASRADSLHIPGTFEVHDAFGTWVGTFTDFKAAESTADLLNDAHPGMGYDWAQVR